MSKFKLVEVSDDLDLDVWVKRNAFFFNEDGSVVCASRVIEQLNDDFIVRDIRFWKYHREIKEPTWKPFPDNESMRHLKDCWFRNKSVEVEFKCCGFDSREGEDVIFLGNTWYDKQELFDDFEVYLNNEWQPVGVKE